MSKVPFGKSLKNCRSLFWKTLEIPQIAIETDTRYFERFFVPFLARKTVLNAAS